MADFETIPCPLCAKNPFAVVYPAHFPDQLTSEFLTTVYRSSSDQTIFEQVVRCLYCNLVYLNPRLAPERIVEAYAEGEDTAFIEQDDMRIRTFLDALQSLHREYGVTLSPETKVLDIGCAGGAFLRAAKALTLTATGVEPSKWLSQYAREKHGLDVRTGTLAEQDFPKESFDLITLWDVIEHLPDPGKELDRIYELLKPGGLLVVNYPDFGSVPAKVLGRKWPFLLSVHLFYYTRQTIRRQLWKHNFQVVRMTRHWQTLELGYVLERATQYFSFFHFVGKIVEKIGWSSFPIKYWIGQTRVVAKKCDKNFSHTKAVIFDMDGVLFLSNDCHEKAWTETLKTIGITHYEYAAIAGMRTDDAFVKLLREHGKEENKYDIPQLVAEKRKKALELLRQEGKIAPGSREVIEYLRKKYRLALASSASPQTVAFFLEKSGYQDAFEIILDGSMVEYAKPAPDIYRLAAKKFGLRPKDCVVIEDSLSGITAALEAYIPTIALVSGEATKEKAKIKSLPLAAEIQTLSELKKIL